MLPRLSKSHTFVRSLKYPKNTEELRRDYPPTQWVENRSKREAQDWQLKHGYELEWQSEELEKELEKF